MKNLIKVLVLSLAFAAPMAISAPGVQAETAHTQPTGSHVKKGSPTATATPTATPAAKPKKTKKIKKPKSYTHNSTHNSTHNYSIKTKEIVNPSLIRD